MNPTLSAYLTGVGSALLFLFLIAKIDQIRRDENSCLHRLIRGIKDSLFSISWLKRWWYSDKREMLLRDLRHLRDVLEKGKADPMNPDPAIRSSLLRQKWTELLNPVGDNRDDVYRAVVFCIAALEIEDDFSKAMKIVTERLQAPFSVRLETDFQGSPGTGFANPTLTEPEDVRYETDFQESNGVGSPEHAQQHLIPGSEKYVSPATKGSVTFDYSNNDGKYSIGSDAYMFETQWSKASDRRIHVYNDPPSIHTVALVKDKQEISSIGDARIYDGSSRARSPNVGQIVLIQNTNGFFAALKVLDIKDDTRGGQFDGLTFEYVIQTNGTPDFTD